jgi:hypothetical protein
MSAVPTRKRTPLMAKYCPISEERDILEAYQRWNIAATKASPAVPIRQTDVTASERVVEAKILLVRSSMVVEAAHVGSQSNYAVDEALLESGAETRTDKAGSTP